MPNLYYYWTYTIFFPRTETSKTFAYYTHGYISWRTWHFLFIIITCFSICIFQILTFFFHFYFCRVKRFRRSISHGRNKINRKKLRKHTTELRVMCELCKKELLSVCIAKTNKKNHIVVYRNCIFTFYLCVYNIIISNQSRISVRNSVCTKHITNITCSKY